MDKVEKDDLINSADTIYAIKSIMNNHNLTADQVLYILCKFHDVEYESSASDYTSLVNKGLIKKDKVNAFLLFDIDKPKQLTLDLKVESKPNGTEFTLDRAHRIEKEFVIDKFLAEDERKRIADEHFKGDISMARYFIIFRSLFPGPKTYNTKWNKKFGFIYDGISLQDGPPSIIKKFKEVYKKLDIGIFLEATYRVVKSSIDLEQERCFMMKPYKYLLIFNAHYREVEDNLKKQKNRSSKDTIAKIDKLKV